MAVQQHPVIVIGAGLAGLTTARVLHQAGFRVRICEAEPEIGGRVRTHTHPEGFLIDRGFQIILSAYPAMQRHVDLGAIGARPFASGAQVWAGSRLVPLTNPIRQPRGLLRDVSSPVFSVSDKLRLARWGAQMTRAPWTTSAEAANATEDQSALNALRAYGFSEDFIDRFARPFWGGIMLDRSLATSAGVVKFTTKMFIAGDGVLPHGGVGDVPKAIAADLPADAIRTSSRVDGLVVEDSRVTGVQVGDTTEPAAAVVVATDPPATARLTGIDAIPTGGVGCVTVYLASDRDPGLGTYLAIDGTGTQAVNHIAPLSAVQPSYAPEGQHLIAAVLLGDEAIARDDASNGEIARQSVTSMLGQDGWRVIDVVNLPYCLFDQAPGVHRRLPDANTGIEGLFLASDATVDASSNGAVTSGEDAAHAVRLAIGDSGQPGAD